jgi:cardiolipin synthase
MELLADTEGFISALARDLDAAADHAHLLYYIFLADESGRAVARALRRAAERGVCCRLLVDAVGSKAFLRSALRRELETGGVEVVAALPTRLRLGGTRIDLRNHRKLAILDGRVAYTGSHNVAAASFAPKPRFAPWVDATVRIEGPAVRDVQELFVEDWYLDTGETLEECLAIAPPEHVPGMPVQVIGTGPDSRHEAVVRLIQAAFHLAREELILTTPYFVPDEGTLDALLTAAERGVRTRLVVPKRNDSRLVGAASRSLYELLLASGVEIHEYTQGLLHAKTITVDRDLALVSTANLDRRSFELNYEASLVVYDSDFASRLRFLQTSYLADSTPVDSAAWARRSWPRKIAQNAAGMFAPIL